MNPPEHRQSTPEVSPSSQHRGLWSLLLLVVTWPTALAFISCVVPESPPETSSYVQVDAAHAVQGLWSQSFLLPLLSSYDFGLWIVVSM